MLHKNRVKNRTHMTSFQVIIISFFCRILVGTLLLMLPISSRQRCVTSFPDAMFTAVSATCVTGLVVKDTATYWSLFGQAVILMLIQIGGMGVITIGLAIIRASGRKIGLRQRSTMQESISAPQVGGIVKLTGFILKTSLIIEMIGAALLAPVFCNDLGIAKGLWYSLFHSISAFCNAGFDLFGIREPFSSLTFYHSNIYLNIIIMMLIITGGIGFLVWGDIRIHKNRIRCFSLQSKVVLMTSAVLIVLPALYFFFYEYDRETIHDRTIHSLFQSVTTRTAGFNTTDLAAMDESGTAIMIILMLIGGSPGSTAGGLKTTTIAVVVIAVFAMAKGGDDINTFKRRIVSDVVKQSAVIILIYLFAVMLSSMIICSVEGLGMSQVLFETASAAGTVGVSKGITNQISAISKIILMIMMYGGRIGGLSLVLVFGQRKPEAPVKRPTEQILIG